MKDIKRFEQDIQEILDRFHFVGETRRKIFSQLMEYASELHRYNEEEQAGNPKKGNQK